MKYEFRDLGTDHEQYFPGVGVAFTDWDAVHTGIGDTLSEAIDDAIENAAQAGVDTFELEDMTCRYCTRPSARAEASRAARL